MSLMVAVGALWLSDKLDRISAKLDHSDHLSLEVRSTPMTFTATVTCADGTTGTFSITAEAGESAEVFGVRARAALNAFKAAFCGR